MRYDTFPLAKQVVYLGLSGIPFSRKAGQRLGAYREYFAESYKTWGFVAQHKRTRQ